MPAVASTIVPPGCRLSVALGGLDHRQADAILDRAAGVLAFELGEQPAGAGIEMGQLDHRRVADEVEGGADEPGCGHGVPVRIARAP